MLCRVETEAVNTAVDAVLEKILNKVLHGRVAGVEVGHTDVTLHDALLVGVGSACVEAVPVGARSSG